MTGARRDSTHATTSDNLHYVVLAQAYCSIKAAFSGTLHCNMND